MDALKIGQYIQHLRKAAGMTQKDLAEKLNISFQAVSKWENGDALPDTGILLELCDELFTGWKEDGTLQEWGTARGLN